MQKTFAMHVTMLAAGALIACSARAFAESGTDGVTDHDPSDRAGDWSSVYPLLQRGPLDPDMAHKAEHGDKTAAEYSACGQIGGDAEGPDYNRFSDYAIAATDAGHFHPSWGDDRAARLRDVTRRPTCCPANLGGEGVVEGIMPH